MHHHPIAVLLQGGDAQVAQQQPRLVEILLPQSLFDKVRRAAEGQRHAVVLFFMLGERHLLFVVVHNSR